MKSSLIIIIFLMHPLFAFTQPDPISPQEPIFSFEDIEADENICMKLCWIPEGDVENILRVTTSSQQLQRDNILLVDSIFLVNESEFDLFEEDFAFIDTLTPKGVEEGSRHELREVLCEDDITEDIIRNIQKRLIENGFDEIFSTGFYDEATESALREYQIEYKLPVGFLNLETLDHLGILF